MLAVQAHQSAFFPTILSAARVLPHQARGLFREKSGGCFDVQAVFLPSVCVRHQQETQQALLLLLAFFLVLWGQREQAVALMLFPRVFQTLAMPFVDGYQAGVLTYPQEILPLPQVWGQVEVAAFVAVVVVGMVAVCVAALAAVADD